MVTLYKLHNKLSCESRLSCRDVTSQVEFGTALVPRGRQRFCETCANKVKRQGRGRPICRTDIQIFLRLFRFKLLCAVFR